MLGGRVFRRQAGFWLLAAAIATGVSACSDDNEDTGSVGPSGSPNLPTQAQLKTALDAAQAEANGGFSLNMWATVVDRSGIVRAVAFTGTKEGDQWPGSRVISAQKANTANAFSLPGLALSTANLYTATQPGGTLFGLQESNPVDPSVAYGGNADDYGTTNDFMVGKRIGGINVFGGGLALYDATGELIGAVGVSGDTSCADHNIAWKVRDGLTLDFIPGGVDPVSGTDNIVYDIQPDGTSLSGWGHPECATASTTIGKNLPNSNPVSPPPAG
jgi:uncharacterized protein GlcG (DUF336 family)